VVVNKRNLSLQDLLSQCAHYNANVRKGLLHRHKRVLHCVMAGCLTLICAWLRTEAILGMKDLFSLHPQTLGSSLAQLFDKVFDLISDEDVYVRQAVRTLFEFLLPLVPAVSHARPRPVLCTC
jgi:hypothetical protein